MSQSLFATAFTKWHFHCHIKVSRIWRFSKDDWQSNYRLALDGEKHLVTVFVTNRNFENRVGDFKALYGKTVSGTKTSGQRANAPVDLPL